MLLLRDYLCHTHSLFFPKLLSRVYNMVALLLMFSPCRRLPNFVTAATAAAAAFVNVSNGVVSVVAVVAAEVAYIIVSLLLQLHLLLLLC